MVWSARTTGTVARSAVKNPRLADQQHRGPHLGAVVVGQVGQSVAQAGDDPRLERAGVPQVRRGHVQQHGGQSGGGLGPYFRDDARRVTARVTQVGQNGDVVRDHGWLNDTD